MKILITDAYCYMNRGDAGIIIAMIQQLRTAYDNPSITVASLYPDLDQHRYGEGVKVIPAPVLPNHEHNKYKKAIKNVMGALKVRRQLLNNNSSAFLNSCREADLIISCGGGYMQCISLKTFISDFIYHYLQLYCAYYLKKRYVVFAQTIGPFSNKICKIIEPIMNNALYVLPREEYSYKFTKNKFPNSNTVLTGDIAFLLRNKKIDINIDDSKTNIGITLRDWKFSGNENAKALNQNYRKSVSNFIEWLSNFENYEVYIIVQCIGPDSDNDGIISNDIYNILSSHGNIHILNEQVNPEEMKYVYSKMNYFIGTRMHSNIFTLAEEVPCMAISYDKKTDGIMKMVGLQDYVVDINTISFENLKSTFMKMVQESSNPEYHAKLHDNVSKAKLNAYKNIEIIKNIIHD